MSRPSRSRRSRPRAVLAATMMAAAAALAMLLALPWRAHAVTGRTNPPHPVIRPPHGHPFTPVIGNWDASADGFEASFALVAEPTLPTRGSRPRYGIADLVVTRPGGCPADPAHAAETLITGRSPLGVSRDGSLGLQRFGFDGSLIARRSATLRRDWRLSCGHGVLRWRVHPVRRPPVTDGRWTAHFRGQGPQRFTVRQGGRLAVSVPLPRSLARCGGAQGAVDLFIAPGGAARLRSASIHASLRFTRGTATGTIDAGGPGCKHGPIVFSASAG